MEYFIEVLYKHYKLVSCWIKMKKASEINIKTINFFFNYTRRFSSFNLTKLTKNYVVSRFFTFYEF